MKKTSEQILMTPSVLDKANLQNISLRRWEREQEHLLWKCGLRYQQAGVLLLRGD